MWTGDERLTINRATWAALSESSRARSQWMPREPRWGSKLLDFPVDIDPELPGLAIRTPDGIVTDLESG